MATINVGETKQNSVVLNTYNGRTGIYRLWVTLKLNSQNIDANTSNVTASLLLSCAWNELAWNYSDGPTFSLSDLVNGGSWTQLSSCEVETYYGRGQRDQIANATTILTKTFTVQHNEDGTGSINIRGIVNANGVPFAPASYTLALGAWDLPQIPRASTIAISPALLEPGNDATVTITGATTAYKVNAWYTIGEDTTQHVLYNNQAIPAGLVLTKAIPWTEIEPLIGTFTSTGINVYCNTFNAGGTQVGSTQSASAWIQTGVIPMSWYDTRQGSVGVTVGEKATGPGFNEYLDATFGNAITRVDIDARNAKTWDIDNTYGIPEYREGDRWACNMSAIWPGYVDGNQENGVVFSVTLPGSLRRINRITLDYIDAWCFGSTWTSNVSTGRVFSTIAEIHGDVSGVPQEKNKLRLKATGTAGTGGTSANVCAAIILTFHES